MPVVRYSAQETPQGGTPRIGTNVNPEAFGTGIAEGLKGVASAGAGLGDEMVQHQILMKQQDNAAENDEALTQLMTKYNDMYYGDNGFGKLEGKGAVDAFPEYRDNLAKARTDIAAKLSNPAVQKMFDNASRTQLMYQLQAFSSHYASERRQYLIGSKDAVIKAQLETAALNYNDDGLFNAALDPARKASVEKSQMLGLSAEEAQVAWLDTAKKAFYLRGEQMGLHDAEKAQDWADANKDMLGPEYYIALSNKFLPMLEANGVEANIEAAKAGLPGVGSAWANSAQAMAQIQKDIPGAVITRGADTAAHNKAIGGAPNSPHIAPGGKAVDFVVPGMSLSQMKAAADAKYGNIPGVTIIAEKKGDKYSTGDHIHIQFRNAPSTGAALPLDIKANGQAYIDRVVDMAKAQRPNDPKYWHMNEARAKQEVAEAVQGAQIAVAQAGSTWYAQIDNDRLNGVVPNFSTYMKNPQLAAAYNATDPTTQLHLYNAVTAASRQPQTVTPEMLDHYKTLKGQALDTTPEAQNAFLAANITGDPKLTNAWKKELINRQLRIRANNQKDPNSNLNYALKQPDIQISMARMGLQKDMAHPNNTKTQNYFKFVSEYSDMIDTFISVHSRQPNNQDLRHMFNQLAVDPGPGNNFPWIKGTPSVLGNVPNDEARAIADQLRANDIIPDPGLIAQMYAGKQAQKAKK